MGVIFPVLQNFIKGLPSKNSIMPKKAQHARPAVSQLFAALALTLYNEDLGG
ncbi:hypothetical protein [Virgibacillus senegalensis]|uniref:hypothetical protein n=1 Tax=Virgibacillus senegalensis TaxID=1499679 RepID=UPI000A692DF6|nr:hypothetical protein [Virgibacillus senegalensis]